MYADPMPLPLLLLVAALGLLLQIVVIYAGVTWALRAHDRHRTEAALPSGPAAEAVKQEDVRDREAAFLANEEAKREEKLALTQAKKANRV